MSMFVATATCGSIPSCIITGTVMSDVPPVTTLNTAVKAKADVRQIKAGAVITAARGSRGGFEYGGGARPC